MALRHIEEQMHEEYTAMRYATLQFAITIRLPPRYADSHAAADLRCFSTPYAPSATLRLCLIFSVTIITRC